MTDNAAQIRALIENWAIWRDAGDWARFATCWHPEGRMMATWKQGTAAEFIEASIAGWNRGVSILHFLGGHSAQIVGERAVAQTKMTISQRATVDGVLVDVVCTGRFCDFVQHHDGVWKLLLRQPIYEKNWMDPLAPDARLSLDAALLAQFPEDYRHLAYLQTRIGYTVKADMPGLRGPAVERLYADGTAWLAGGALAR